MGCNTSDIFYYHPKKVTNDKLWLDVDVARHFKHKSFCHITIYFPTRATLTRQAWKKSHLEEAELMLCSAFFLMWQGASGYTGSEKKRKEKWKQLKSTAGIWCLLRSHRADQHRAKKAEKEWTKANTASASKMRAGLLCSGSLFLISPLCLFISIVNAF